jgi:hypothetical protein
MKKKYNTLNEEMNRMKSLFGESRLYGNLVGNEKTNLITEQGPGKRFFARNLAKAFSVSLKSFEDLGQFTKFLNREINSVDDMIKHVDDFPVMWKAVTRNKIDMSKVRKNLDLLKKIDKGGKFKGLSKENALTIVNGFPAEGGMQDMVKDMWLVANGKSLPTVIDTRIAVIDPKSGELIFGKQNSETGVVVATNSNGDIVTVEKPKGEWKKGDDIDVERTDIEGEFVDFEEIPNGTPLDDLNGKKVDLTDENVEAVLEAIEKLGKEEAAKGNTVINNFYVSDSKGVEINMGSGSGSGGKSTDEMAQEIVENTTPPKDVPEAELLNWKQKAIKATKSRLWKIGKGTRYWWNPLTIGESFPKTHVGFENKRYGQVILRTFVLLPLTYEAYKTIDSEERVFYGPIEHNFIGTTYQDFMDFIGYSSNFKDDIIEASEYLIATTIRGLSQKKIDPDLVRVDVKKRVSDEIYYINTDTINPETGERFSTLTCEKLLSMSSDGDVIKYLFENHMDNTILREMKKIDVKGISTDNYQKLKDELQKFMVTVMGNTNSSKKFVDSVEKVREKCKTNQKTNKEMIEFMKDDYEVTFIPGDSTGLKNVMD